eukprot:TRINITY_DN8489_c0_g1_i1.p1 TRINITY_DN8489_c0_g1~~TRINITY_DN8489_c0_g1_i1.p1  ORF type:complete len:221 (-),score=29.09 TRINITY_DN8489_c0_g1_i1:138-800(-)
MAKMRSQELADALEGRTWKVSMLQTPCSHPLKCVYGTCCPCAGAYSQRREILEITAEPYICNNGAGWCCCCTSPVPEDKVPLYLGLESCCCTCSVVAGNRYMIQTRFGRENDSCDNCLLCCVCVLDTIEWLLSCVWCILNVFNSGTGSQDVGDCLGSLAMVNDMLQCAVLGCVYAQQQVELEVVNDEHINYSGPPPEVMELLPPSQLKMIQAGASYSELH